MRLINKYETSMGGLATIGLRIGSGLEAGVVAGGRAAKITQEINIQVGQTNGVLPSLESLCCLVLFLFRNLNKLHTFDFRLEQVLYILG